MHAKSDAPRLLAASAIIIISAFGAASCADRTTAPPAMSNETALPSPRGTRPDETAARASDFSARGAQLQNALYDRSAWVGAEHNLALAAVMAERKSLRKLGRGAQCRSVDRALRRHFGGRAATHIINLDLAAIELGQRTALLQLGCAESDLAFSATLPQPRSEIRVLPASFTTQTWSISSPAQELLGRIETSIYSSSSPAAVESAVLSIIAAASGFDLVNSSVVGAAGSTTVSSSYYWNGYYTSRGGVSTEEPMSLFQGSFWERARPAVRADLLGGVGALMGACGGPVPSAACTSGLGLLSIFLSGASTGSVMFAIAAQ